MAHIMREILMRMIFMEKVVYLKLCKDYMSGLIEDNIMVTGLKIKCMGMG